MASRKFQLMPKLHLEVDFEPELLIRSDFGDVFAKYFMLLVAACGFLVRVSWISCLLNKLL